MLSPQLPRVNTPSRNGARNTHRRCLCLAQPQPANPSQHHRSLEHTTVRSGYDPTTSASTSHTAHTHSSRRALLMSGVLLPTLVPLLSSVCAPQPAHAAAILRDASSEERQAIMQALKKVIEQPKVSASVFFINCKAAFMECTMSVSSLGKSNTLCHTCMQIRTHALLRTC